MAATNIIAEIGVNHNGSLARAVSLIHQAAAVGADIAKFQLFRDRPAIENLRLTLDDMFLLHDVCEEVGIEFLCTPFYLEAVAELDPLVKRHKVASGFLTDKAMLDAVFATGKPVIVSTGMAEVNQVLMAMGRLGWRMGAGNSLRDISVLHCVSAYPCPDEDANLNVIRMDGFSGYSDHTTGIVACVAAVALGARIIEKHITLDKTAQGPDHACSAEPEEFAEMVRQIRRVEKMLGDGVKRIMPSEAECAKVWRNNDK